MSVEHTLLECLRKLAREQWTLNTPGGRVWVTQLKTGERVMFSGGILGTIANVKDNTFVIKIADKVKIEVARSAVTNVVPKGEKPTDEPG